MMRCCLSLRVLAAHLVPALHLSDHQLTVTLDLQLADPQDIQGVLQATSRAAAAAAAAQRQT